MPRFFIQARPVDGFLAIEGEDAHHISRVLRMKPGDEVTLCDSAGADFDCIIEDASPSLVRCRVRGEFASAGEPSAFITLFMALPKADKMEFIIQKSVELGASRIVPFLSARCVSRPNAAALRKKTERWQRIAAEAAKQCGRGLVPQVCETIPFSEAVRQAAESDTALFFYECERDAPLRGAIGGRELASVSVTIGPEGGFALEEAEQARAGGLQSVSLGKRILRCETAPLAALAAILYESGNF